MVSDGAGARRDAAKRPGGAHDTRRALSGLRRHCRDLTAEPLSEPVGGRSSCFMGRMGVTSEQVLIATVIQRWNGKVAPRPLPFRTSPYDRVIGSA
jgi:hypothetical protein